MNISNRPYFGSSAAAAAVITAGANGNVYFGLGLLGSGVALKIYQSAKFPPDIKSAYPLSDSFQPVTTSLQPRK